MKEKSISLRLTESEKKKLDLDAATAKMKPSQYIRHLLAGSTPQADNSKQELATQFCYLYKVIQEQNLENNEALMEEVTRLCRILY